jgi:hypothetical protein
MVQPLQVQSGPGSRMSRFNRFFARWLASPLGFLSGRAVLVRYTGRVSGLQRRLPVNVNRLGDEYLIYVGLPERKTWWHNFRSPWPVELVRGPRVVRGSAVVVAGSTGRGRALAAGERGAVRRGGAGRRGPEARVRRGHAGLEPGRSALGIAEPERAGAPAPFVAGSSATSWP